MANCPECGIPMPMDECHNCGWSPNTHIVNFEEIETFLFEHAHKMGHACYAEKNENRENIAWIDGVTQERIDIIYEEITNG